MNAWNRIFISLCAGCFLSLCYLMFFSIVGVQKKSQYEKIKSECIMLKLIHLKDLITDLKDLSKNLQVKNAIANIQFNCQPDIQHLENTFKMALLSEVIEIKALMMQETLKEIIDEIETHGN